MFPAANPYSTAGSPGWLVRSLTTLSLRLALGLVFLSAGLDHLRAVSAATPGPSSMSMVDPFRDAFLANPFPQAVPIYSTLRPYVEFTLAGLLLPGLFTSLAAALSSFWLLLLLSGTLLRNDPTAPAILMAYLLVNATLLWLSNLSNNWFSLDGLFFGLIGGVITQRRRSRGLEAVAHSVRQSMIRGAEKTRPSG